MYSQPLSPIAIHGNHAASGALVLARKPHENGVINQSLPAEVLIQIFGDLPPESLARARKVCEYWRYLVDDLAPRKCFDRFQKVPLLRFFSHFNQDDELIVDENTMEIARVPSHESLAVIKARVHQAWFFFARCADGVMFKVPKRHPHFISLDTLRRLDEGLNQRITDNALIAFCEALPEQIRLSLPSLQNTNHVSIEVFADMLRIQILLSPEVRELQVLDLSGCDLSHCPPEIRYFRSLVSLNLSENKISYLPDQIGELFELRELSVFGNQIQGFPDIFGSLPHLKRLFLNSNHIRQLPPSIVSCLELEELDATSNQLESLPDQIGALGSLTRICLSGNHLTQLPPSFTELEALQFCNLSSNRLRSLPNGFGMHFPDLEELYLGGNELSTLPDSFGFCQNLFSLELDENQLTSVPQTFEHLHRLGELNLSHNLLSTLPAGFSGMGELEDLKLQYNRFEVFPEALFSLYNLNILDVSNNQIRVLQDRFAEMEELSVLDISHNLLRGLPESLASIAKLTYVGNPIRQARMGPAIKERLALLQRFRPY